MSHVSRVGALGTVALLASLGTATANAQQIKTVFVIAMENHNWTQPATQTSPAQIFQNPNAPFINSLVNGTATAVINGSVVNISQQVAYAPNYHNVLSTPDGNNPSIHPSEPNYLWAEAGTNFGVFNDNDPFSASGPTNQDTDQHLVALLTKAGHTWRSYQEDIDLVRNASGQLTNVPRTPDQYTVPLKSISGVFAPGFVNQFNKAPQYNYAAKHNPVVFFTDANGGNDTTTTNPLASQYAPLQQLFTDLANGAVADYNWITPNQYNDMHSSLSGGYSGLTGDASQLKAGDDFLKQIIPMIMASSAYRDHGAIIIWNDETEGGDDFSHTSMEIIISPRAHENVNGLPWASPLNYTHSSDLVTMQKIFRVGPLLGDAVNATDLSDLFKPGAVPRRLTPGASALR